MALIKCPECGKEVSDTIKECPNCGFKLKKGFIQLHKKLICIIALILILGAGGIIYMSSYKSISYEQNNIIECVNWLKKNTVNKDSIDIKKIYVSYNNQDTIKRMDNIKNKEEPLPDVLNQNIISVLISYNVLSDSDESTSSDAAFILDNHSKFILALKRDNSVDLNYEESLLYEVLKRQTDIGLWTELDSKSVDNIKELLNSKKKLKIHGEFPEIQSEDIHYVCKKYVTYVIGKNDISEIQNLKNYSYLDYFIDKKNREASVKEINTYYYNQAESLYENAKNENKDENYDEAVSQYNEAIQMIKNGIGNDSELDELNKKCLDEKATAEEMRDYRAAIRYMEDGDVQEALDLFNKNPKYKDTSKYIETLNKIKKWEGKWEFSIPDESLTMTCSITIYPKVDKDNNITMEAKWLGSTRGEYYTIEDYEDTVVYEITSDSILTPLAKFGKDNLYYLLYSKFIDILCTPIQLNDDESITNLPDDSSLQHNWKKVTE